MEMKKVLTLIAAAGIIASASTSFALIKNGKHDMSPTGSAAFQGTGGPDKLNGTTSTQICIYCHTPHGAQSVLPLWNRGTDVGDGSNFILYSGRGTANVTFSSGFTSDSPSLFCMSCHDGSTNVNNVVHNVKSGELPLTDGLVGGTGNLTTNLGNSITNGQSQKVTHPINFPVTNNDQNDLWTVNADGMMGTDNAGSVTVAGLPLYATSRTNGGTAKTSVECSSCHSVHNYENSPFLRYTMAGSALCLGCHNK